jgi:acetylornithine deacetylase/succinyl-diaminopimelate desuccinylase-like protein
MNRVVEKLGTYRPEMKLVPTAKQCIGEMAKFKAFRALSSLLQETAKSDKILDMLAQRDKYLAEELRASIRMTVAPTMISGGVKENIIPSECDAVFDCRILPGQTTAGALRDIKDFLRREGVDRLSFEVIQANEPSESPLKTPLYDTIVRVLKDIEPGASAIPLLLTGGTDSRFFRKRGSVCYGFHPVLPETSYSTMMETVHGIDERISTRNLVFGTSVLYKVIEQFMT